ncbi:MAG: MscL family protein [Gemmatimonadaceae bacterium]
MLQFIHGDPMLGDFKAFLLKANVVGLALAVIVGGAAGALVKAMSDDFIMPIIGAATPGGEWRKYTVDVGTIKFGVGDFVGVFLNFAIVSFVAWQIGKYFIRPDPPAPPTQTCSFCKSAIAVGATRCPHCTSQL